MFHDKNSTIFLTVITFCFTLVPTSDIHDICNEIGFWIIFAILYSQKRPSYPNGDFSIYRYRETGSTIAMIFISMSVSCTNEK